MIEYTDLDTNPIDAKTEDIIQLTSKLQPVILFDIILLKIHEVIVLYNAKKKREENQYRVCL